MKTKKVKVTDDFQFKLWKENKLDQEYTMTLGEFKTKFFEWVKSGAKNRSWFEYYGSSGAVIQFTGNKEGLNSNVEPGDLKVIRKAIKEGFWNIVEAMEKKP